jgi:pimeloyl-ACP methyl ester carboxylesterase
MSPSRWRRRRRVRSEQRTATSGREVDLPGRGRLYVREAAGPRRAPTLVLLHGLAATAALNWDACIPALAERYRVLAPDHRGHGRGIRCGGNFRLEDCADDVAALIEQEVGGPALVAGYSMGGPITQLLCGRHPRLVAGMILCATARDFRGRPAERLRFGVLSPIALACRLAPPVPVGLIPDALRHNHRFGSVLGELSGHQSRAVLAAASCLGEFTSRTWVSTLAAPAVVVVTSRDRTVPPRRQLKLAAALDAPVIRIDAGHFVPSSDPHLLAAAVREAADRLSRRRHRAA